ncbi:MAG: YdcF family protein [Pseudomonadota bacterium]
MTARPTGRKRWGIVRWTLTILATLIVLWLAGFVWFAERAVWYTDPGNRQADAIVVLTGGSERLNHGVALLRQGSAENLFVSGVHPGIEAADLPALQEIGEQDLPCCITLGYDAGNTAENAAETATWIDAQDLGSIRLVTSNYHMPRSLVEFRRLMPDLEIIADPVDPAPVMLDEWYRWPGTASLLFREYNKSLIALGRSWLSQIL